MTLDCAECRSRPKHHERRVAPTPVGCLWFRPLGPLFEISFTVLHSWIAVHYVPVHGLFPQIHLGALSIGPTVQTCSTQLGLCHRGGLRTGFLLVSELSVSWLTPCFITVSFKKSGQANHRTSIVAMRVVSYCYDLDHILTFPFYWGDPIAHFLQLFCEMGKGL
jgi:hypothetical protein